LEGDAPSAESKIVTADRPDLILLDLFMPGMDGFEVCRRIKSDPQTQATIVVAITAHPSAESEKAILGAGAKAFLPKPLDAKNLVSLVETLLGRRA
jgi:CheY-like chemotaxis protein